MLSRVQRPKTNMIQRGSGKDWPLHPYLYEKKLCLQPAYCSQYKKECQPDGAWSFKCFES
jgi:hypothetical protein